MPEFSRRTIIAAVATLEGVGHSNMTRFLLEHGLQNTEAEIGHSASLKDRANAIIAYLLKHPEALTEDGENLSDTIVRDLLARAIERVGGSTAWSVDEFDSFFPGLNHALKRDGFMVQEGVLRRALPETLDLPKTDDEVHGLLKRFGFLDPTLGHLEQAIQNHAQGLWAAANSMLRSFVDALLDDIAATLISDPTNLPLPGYQRIGLLAKMNPPFLLSDLNEWTGQGTGFIEGFRRRLHPQGSHPGLSDEDDCTFRLHLVLVVAGALLRRLDARMNPSPRAS